MGNNINSWTDLQWIVLYTNAKAERKVAELLVKKGYESYLPLHRQRHRWSDRMKWVEVPLFPSYVFTRIIGKELSLVRELNGVVCPIAFGTKKEVAIVPDWEIESMRKLMASDVEVFVKKQVRLRKGAHVRLLSGPFEGMKGTLVSDCQDGNFSVQVSALNSDIVFDAGKIEKEMLEFLNDGDEQKGMWIK